MSLIQVFKKKSNINLFTTPSHSQKFFIFSKLRQFYKYDISETDTHNPQEALALAEKRAAKIYKTKSTRFLTNGSTSGIIAAVLTCVKSDEKVLIWGNAHPSHKNAVQLAGAAPVYYELEKDEEWGIYKSTAPEQIEKFLKEQDIKALIITSPSYEGVVSNVKKIKEICKKYDTYLIVDEAHGALYPFSDKLPKSAIYLGADFVIQSLHKTAGGLNPTALLHCNTSDGRRETGDEEKTCHCEGEGSLKTARAEAFTPAAIQKNMNIEKALEMISTTSPSYPLLASIEKNIDFLNSSRGRKKINELIDNIEKMKKHLPNCEFYQGDPTKILVRGSGIGGFEFSETLFKAGIEDEKTNEKSTMLLCGIGTDLKKLKKLEQALKKINKKA